MSASDWKNLPGGAAESLPPVTAVPSGSPETRPFPATPTAGVVTQGGCQVCGRGPAQWFTVRRHVGMLLLQKFYKANALLCRDHAIPVVKEYLGKTLVQGWWGVISFFVNFVVVGQDLGQLVKAKKMPAPQG